MTPRKLIFAPFAAALIGASAPPSQPADSPAALRVKADVEFLASDLLEGRDTGSRGYEIGAAYVASQFRAIGLTPGGPDGGWYQRVPFRRASHAQAPQASLLIGTKIVPMGRDDLALRPSIRQQARTIDAPLIFVRYGVSDPRLGIDNYRGLDVRGKIVVALEGTPAGLPSEIAAHLNSFKQMTAASKGALGLILILGTGPTPGHSRLSEYDQPVMDWVDSTGKTASQSTPLAIFGAMSRDAAKQLFKPAGQDLSRIVAAGSRDGAQPGFALPARLRASDRMTRDDFTSPEVIGLLPGADPALRDEYVVLMGHLDHLGIKSGARPGEDAIYNGALDNAAGVATMLEAARLFVASGKPPRRSVLFIANTGEERGLRGADYFAAHPTVPVDKIVGLVDLDMPMLLYDFTDVVAFGGEHSTLNRAIADAAGSMSIAVSPDPMPEETIFVRSDHYRFVTRGIPGILLMTGYANGGEAKWKRFFAETYHKPADNVNQPIRWDQGARYAELNYRIARALADADQRPLWYKGDYFGDTFAPAQPKAEK